MSNTRVKELFFGKVKERRSIGGTKRKGDILENRKENKMGVMPIPKLLVSMSVPIMASMMIQALYNVVDSIFVAKVSEDALTSVSLAFPLQTLLIAVSVGTAVGVNALLSRKLGEKNYDDANAIAGNGMFLALASSVAAVLFVLFGGVKIFFSAFVGEGDIMNMGVSYTSIVVGASVGLFVSVTGERLLQATGLTIHTMISQMVGAITNIILDPIMIFGIFGFPKLGVTGAAVATVCGQLVSMVLNIVFNIKYNKDIKLELKHLKPIGRIIGEIYAIGLPAIFMQAIGSVMTFGMNKILIVFSQTAVSVFGIYFKLQSFIFMPIFGLTNGMMPIVGFNYGARNRDRVISTIKLATILSVSIMAVGVVIFQCFPEFLLKMFDASEQMMTIGTTALRIISSHFVFAGVSIILSSTFQAFGKGIYSLIMSLIRQLLVLLPSAYILGTMISLDALWFSFLIAEVVALLLASGLFVRLYRNVIAKL